MELIFSCCNSREEEGQLYSKIDQKSFIIQPIVNTYESIGVNDQLSMYRKVQNVQKDVITVKLVYSKNKIILPLKVQHRTFSQQNSSMNKVNQKQTITYRTIPPFSLSKYDIKTNSNDTQLNVAIALSILSRKSEIMNRIIIQQENSLCLYLKIQGKIYKIGVNQETQSQYETNREQMEIKIINDLTYIIAEGIKKIYGENGVDQPNSNKIDELIQSITFAPNLIIQTQNKKQKEKEQLWLSLYDHIQMNRLIICKTKSSTKIPLLEPNSHYLLLSTENQDTNRTETRNLFIESIYKEECNNKQYHSLSINFEDLLQNFTTLSINTFLKNSHWTCRNIQQYKIGKGDHLQLYITEQSIYNIKITQSLYHSQQIKPSVRGTLILFQKQATTYQYIDGRKTKHQQSTVLSMQLKPGKYVVYCKIDKQVGESFPNWAKVQVYSQNEVQLLPAKDLKYKSLLLKGFLTYSQKNKRQLFEHGLMWMSFQQLQNCGYAFVVFGNKIGSLQQFKVIFNEQDFHKCGYKLKKPFKGKKIQQLFINPGEQRIILCRKINDQTHPSKFPPKMQILKIPIHPNPHQP